jgi:hypothetical protein
VATYLKSNIQNIGCVARPCIPAPSCSGDKYTSWRLKLIPSHLCYPKLSQMQPRGYSLLSMLCSSVLQYSNQFPTATNSTGIKTTTVTRLVPIACTIVLILCGVVLAIVTTFWYGRKPNVLDEEPTGLLSSALILHGGVAQLINGLGGT